MIQLTSFQGFLETIKTPTTSRALTWLSNAPQSLIKHRIRVVAVVIPERELIHILAKVLTGYPDMSSPDAQLEPCPEPLNALDVSVTFDKLLGSMAHADMIVAVILEGVVRA